MLLLFFFFFFLLLQAALVTKASAEHITDDVALLLGLCDSELKAVGQSINFAIALCKRNR